MNFKQLLEQERQKLQTIFKEADEQRDQLLRDQALTISEQIIDQILSMDLQTFMASSSNFRAFAEDRVDFFIVHLGVQHKEYNIAFFEDGMIGEGGFSKVDRNTVLENVIMVYGIDFDKPEGTLEDCLERFQFFLEDNEQRIQTALFHEIIHSLDYEREEIPSTIATSRTKSNQDYYQHGLELNAYYQEAINQFERTADPQQLQHVSFEYFWKLMKDQFFDPSFVNYMDGETERRIRKRLYQYWFKFQR